MSIWKRKTEVAESLSKASREVLLYGDEEERAAKQHNKGKLSARERIDLLVDSGSFVETRMYSTSREQELVAGRDPIYGDGVVTGSATIGGRQVFLSSQDFTVMGGSLGEAHANKIAEAQEMALKNRVPFIFINDSGGARIQEGTKALAGYGRIFRNNVHASGVIPQFSVIVGPCAGGAAYSPALSDFVLMVDKISSMYVTGPAVIKAITGEVVDHEGLGGALIHGGKSGNSHFRFRDEKELYPFLRDFLSYLPSSSEETPPATEGKANTDNSGKIESILPENPRHAYDIRDVIGAVVDGESFLEVQSGYALNIVVGLAKLDGQTIGIVANQPKMVAGVLDINASDKGSRFIRFCDSFNIPIITLVDVPGYLPGVDQEHGGIIRHGAKMLYSIAEATVPKISLIIRKAYGGAMIVMAAKSLGYDRVLSYPDAEIAVMGPESAANIIFRKDIEKAPDQEAERARKVQKYRDELVKPIVAAQLGYIDEIIKPGDSRSALIMALKTYDRKKEVRPPKKHGNMPL